MPKINSKDLGRLTTLLVVLPIVLCAQLARQNDPIPLKQWAAPLYWQPAPAAAEERVPATPAATGSLPANANPLLFVAMTPCRVADTRAPQGFQGAFGPPSLAGGSSRTFPIQSSYTCSIPAAAQAYSFNITAVPPGPLGYITAYPTGQSLPLAAVLNSSQGTPVGNATVVPGGTNGSIDVFASNPTDIVIDINGYYAASGQSSSDPSYLINYAANLNVGDSVINITNSGATGAGLGTGTSAAVTGAICVNVYAFDPTEEIVSCCSCPVTPNGLVSLSAQRDLISNPLFPIMPTSIVIKLVATAPVGGSCNGSAILAGTPSFVAGMLAWGTTLHLNTSIAAPVTYAVTEERFSNATLSAGEQARLAYACGIVGNQGGGFGVCASCRLGALGTVRQ